MDSRAVVRNRTERLCTFVQRPPSNLLHNCKDSVTARVPTGSRHRVSTTSGVPLEPPPPQPALRPCFCHLENVSGTFLCVQALGHLLQAVQFPGGPPDRCLAQELVSLCHQVSSVPWCGRTAVCSAVCRLETIEHRCIRGCSCGPVFTEAGQACGTL